jgi:hypothetical protein
MLSLSRWLRSFKEDGPLGKEDSSVRMLMASLSRRLLLADGGM